MIEGVKKIVGSEDADGKPGDLFVNVLFDTTEAAGEGGWVGVCSGAGKHILGGWEVGADVPLIDKTWPARGGPQVAVS